MAQIKDHFGPPILSDNTTTYWTHLVSTLYDPKPLSMMVDMQQLFIIGILLTVRYLIRQVAYSSDIVYAPIREYDSSGERLYSEMHTADWWWDAQVWNMS